MNNATGVYGSISDVSLKENIIDATPKLNDLLKVRIRNFNLKDNKDRKDIGVIADELELIFPNLVEKNGDGFKTVKYSIFTPMLIKAIQEQQTLIESLTARIEKLEGKI